jgi:hypothetical protein
MRNGFDTLIQVPLGSLDGSWRKLSGGGNGAGPLPSKIKRGIIQKPKNGVNLQSINKP